MASFSLPGNISRRTLKNAIGNIIKPRSGKLTEVKFKKLIKNIRESSPGALKTHQQIIDSVARSYKVGSANTPIKTSKVKGFLKALVGVAKRKPVTGFVLTGKGRGYMAMGEKEAFKKNVIEPEMRQKMGTGPTREELAAQKAKERDAAETQKRREEARTNFNLYQRQLQIEKEQGRALGQPVKTEEKSMTSISEINKKEVSASQSSSKNPKSNPPKNSSVPLVHGSFGGAGGSLGSVPVKGGNAFYGKVGAGSGTDEKTSDGAAKDESQAPADDDKPVAEGDKKTGKKAGDEKPKETDNASPEPEKSKSEEPPTSGLFE